MDQRSMILGWLIGRQLAGQRNPTNAKILKIHSLNMDVIAEEAIVRLDADGANYHVFPESVYGALPLHSIGILTSLYNDGHLIITTNTKDDTV